MSSVRVLSTVLNWPENTDSAGEKTTSSSFNRTRRHAAAIAQNTAGSSAAELTTANGVEAQAVRSEDVEENELMLPKRSSLVIILLTSALLQISFFIIVSSSNEYSVHLGGGDTFSGLVIGIPTVFSGLALLPIMKIDQGKYKRPLHIACGSALLGNVLYALAYRANFLYLILIGRIVSGVGFTFWMYSKRYCSDPRIVGIRRRTTLASYLVVGQAGGFALGPLFGGLLYKVGFANTVFNGYTAPGWIMAGVWVVYWSVAAYFYEDEEAVQPKIPLQPVATPTSSIPLRHSISARQYAVIGNICWVAMMCFFILGAWESNIPIFSSGKNGVQAAFHWSPFQAGNFIAIGGGAVLPFLIMNVRFSRLVQDRHILAVGTSLGLAGLIIMLALILASEEGGVLHALNYGSFFSAWFLVALGFNLASTCTISLLSKQLPGAWNNKISFFIQYSNYAGRVTGAVWGGAGANPIGMRNYLGLQIAIVGMGMVAFMMLWKDLKAKTG